MAEGREYEEIILSRVKFLTLSPRGRCEINTVAIVPYIKTQKKKKDTTNLVNIQLSGPHAWLKETPHSFPESKEWDFRMHFIRVSEKNFHDFRTMPKIFR